MNIHIHRTIVFLMRTDGGGEMHGMVCMDMDCAFGGPEFVCLVFTRMPGVKTVEDSSLCSVRVDVFVC